MSARVTAAVVDDEPLARERLRTLLAGAAGVELVAECEDGAEAVRALRSLRPRLVFLDVQMPELDGFEVLAALGAEAPPGVVFVTAHDDFAIRAFDVHAVDYLLKPFSRPRFERALERALERLRGGEPSGAGAVAQAIRRERLPVRTNEGVYFVPVREIDWVEADGNYLTLHAGRLRHQLRSTLKELESKLDPERFVRVHRSALVNVESIQRLEPWFHGEYVVVLRGGERLTSGRTFSDRLRQLAR